MTKKTRRARPPGELKQELADQVALLIHACKAFDSGLKPIAKHISLSLRVLLYHHGQSQALLQQLGLCSKRFMDSAGDLNPNNLLTDCPLCLMRISDAGAVWLPLCADAGGPIPPKWIQFEEWWNKPIIKDTSNRSFNRRELILNVADTDGGAHVDSTLEEPYLELSRENSLGIIITRGGASLNMEGPQLPCIRQIAHELLETLKKKASDFIHVPYET